MLMTLVMVKFINITLLIANKSKTSFDFPYIQSLVTVHCCTKTAKFIYKKPVSEGPWVFRSFYGIIVLLVVVTTLQDFLARRKSSETPADDGDKPEGDEESKENEESKDEEKGEEKKHTGKKLLNRWNRQLYYLTVRLIQNS